MQNRDIGPKEKIKTNDPLLQNMRRCYLLKDLDDDCFEQVVKLSHTRQLSQNSILFEQSSALTDLYLLVSGRIKLVRLSPNGDEKVIDIISPGHTFAEAALLSGQLKYPVTAVALMPSVIVGFQAQPYLKLLQSSTKLCLDMLVNLSQRLHWMINEVDRLTFHSATFRLVDYLLNEIPSNHLNQAKHQTFMLVAPKQVIASRLSIKPETLSRTLKNLVQKQLIRIDGAQIEILDIEQLRDFVSLE